MIGRKSEIQSEKLKIMAIAILMIVVCSLLYYFHVALGTGRVVTHFFYIPIILAALWWRRKGLVVAILLSAILILSHLFLRPEVTTVNDFIRAFMFIVVGCVAAALSEHIARGREALRETNEYLENLINYANAPIIVWDPDFRIIRFNCAFERLTGRGAEEVMGKTLDLLFPEDSREDSMFKIRSTTSGKRWETVEIPIQNADGTERIALWNSATLYAADGETVIATIAQGHDITERKRAEEALTASKAYAESIIENFLDTLIVVDAEARIKTVNPVTCHLLGYTEKEIIGQPASMIFAEEEEEEVKRVFQFFRDPERSKDIGKDDTIRNKELHYKTKDGLLIPMSFNASVITDETGDVTSVVAGAKDITEIKLMEEARLKSEEHHRKVIENIFKFVPEGILVLTEKLNLFRENKAFRDIVEKYSTLLNYTEQELAEIIVEQVKERIINDDNAEIRIKKNRIGKGED